jgi:hypothetical protein
MVNGKDLKGRGSGRTAICHKNPEWRYPGYRSIFEPKTSQYESLSVFDRRTHSNTNIKVRTVKIMIAGSRLDEVNEFFQFT